MAVPTEQELNDLLETWDARADDHVEWLSNVEDSLPANLMEDLSAYWNARSNAIDECKEELQALMV